MNPKRGADHYRWNAGRIISSHGYVRVRVDKAHPLSDPNGYAYEHDLVLFDAGIRLAPGELAHHRNEDKLDNRIENLEVKTRAEHNREHNARRGRDSRGRFLPAVPE